MNPTQALEDILRGVQPVQNAGALRAWIRYGGEHPLCVYAPETPAPGLELPYRVDLSCDERGLIRADTGALLYTWRKLLVIGDDMEDV